VTINGVRVSRDKHDIPIPQGIAHAVERVMFPLPVGNIIQTLRSDRERRFTKFLRAIQTSGLTDTLTGNLPLAVHNMVLGVSCGLVRGYRRFGGKFCLHLQGIKCHDPEDHSVSVHVGGNLKYLLPVVPAYPVVKGRHQILVRKYRIFSNLIRTSFCRFLKRKKKKVSSRF